MDVEYSEDRRQAMFDGYKFRLDMKAGYYLSTKRTDLGRRERLHCYIWRHYNGSIPEGYHIHHIDEDKSNNDIDNLRCVPKSEHLQLHSLEYSRDHHDKIMKNLAEKVRPKAAEWHRSEQGRAFHAEQARKNAAEIGMQEYICQQCGVHFYRKPLGRKKFCSNACKSAARRKSEVDNETRRCAVCGKEYSTNKYSTRKACSPQCGRIIRSDRKYKENGKRACIQHGS